MQLAEFNSRYYSNSNYSVNSALFTDSTQIITIHRFVDAKEAIAYWKHLAQEESPLRRYTDADHQEFPISTQNYATFYNRKNVEAYLRFMERYLLKEN